jgi:C1A family cysteine protease
VFISLIAVTAVAIAAGAFVVIHNNSQRDIPTKVQIAFRRWAMKHNRAYNGPEQLNYRLSVFYQNYKLVAKQNAMNDGVTYELNRFADMTKKEFKTKMLGFRFSTRAKNYVDLSKRAPPASIDWRDKKAVNPVKDQGQCGSCWAFSTIGSLESRNFIINKKDLISLSEQQLVDCSTSYGNMGCDGGLMDYGFQYIRDHGITTEKKYPYTAQDGNCVYHKKDKAASIKSYHDVKPNKCKALEAAIAEGPVSVAVDAENWSFYKKGVYKSSKCGTSLDHGVTAIGYGATSNGSPFWIIRNSWAASWGENGYIRLEKGNKQKAGTCGVCMDPSYPTF